jgi:hypothetical protein
VFSWDVGPEGTDVGWDEIENVHLKGHQEVSAQHSTCNFIERTGKNQIKNLPPDYQ